MAAKKRTVRRAKAVRTPIGGRRKPDPKATAKAKATAKTKVRRGANLAAQHAAHLRKIAMGYPETVEDFPWGHAAYKVRKKIFLTLVVDDMPSST